jgi:hypothetical protein
MNRLSKVAFAVSLSISSGCVMAADAGYKIPGAIGPFSADEVIYCTEADQQAIEQAGNSAVESLQSYYAEHPFKDTDWMQSCLDNLNMPSLNFPIFGGDFNIDINDILKKYCDYMVDKFNDKLDEVNESVKEETGGYITVKEGDAPKDFELWDGEIELPGLDGETYDTGGFGTGKQYQDGDITTKGLNDSISGGVTNTFRDGVDNVYNSGEASDIRKSANDANDTIQRKKQEILEGIKGLYE